MPSVFVVLNSLYVARMGFGQGSVAVTLNQQGRIGKGESAARGLWVRTMACAATMPSR